MTEIIKTNNINYQKTLKTLSIIAREVNEPILLLGGVGVGKTRIAKFIHEIWCEYNNKIHSKTPFKDFNCATLNNPLLIQAALFGHIKGAFTGAIKDNIGLIKSADGGTLFLDEIGELDMASQINLLKVLEHGYFSPVGSTEIEKSNFRLICATNKNLEQAVSKNLFREDLYTRLSNWVFRLKGLKELPEDIEFHIKNKLEEWNIENNFNIVFLKSSFDKYYNFAKSDDAKWYGNFRDLKRSINRMARFASIKSLGGKNKITDKIVDNEIHELKKLWNKNFIQKQSDSSLFLSLKNKFEDLPLVYAVEDFLINSAIIHQNGNKAKAAKLLYGQSTNLTSKINDRRNFLSKKF